MVSEVLAASALACLKVPPWAALHPELTGLFLLVHTWVLKKNKQQFVITAAGPLPTLSAPRVTGCTHAYTGTVPLLL